jgi:hypothetical protein
MGVLVVLPSSARAGPTIDSTRARMEADRSAFWTRVRNIRVLLGDWEVIIFAVKAGAASEKEPIRVAKKTRPSSSYARIISK